MEGNAEVGVPATTQHKKKLSTWFEVARYFTNILFRQWPDEARPVHHPLSTELLGDPVGTSGARWKTFLDFINDLPTSIGNKLKDVDSLKRNYASPILSLVKEICEIDPPNNNDDRNPFEDDEECLTAEKDLGYYDVDYVVSHTFTVDGREMRLGYTADTHGPTILKPQIKSENLTRDGLVPEMNLRRLMALLLIEMAILQQNDYEDPALMGLKAWTEYGNRLAAEAAARAQEQLQIGGARLVINNEIALNAAAVVPVAAVAAGRGAGRGRGGRGRGRGAAPVVAAGIGAAAAGPVEPPVDLPPTIERTMDRFVTQIISVQNATRDETARAEAVSFLLSDNRLAVERNEVLYIFDELGIDAEDTPASIARMIHELDDLRDKARLMNCLKPGPRGSFRAAFHI